MRPSAAGAPAWRAGWDEARTSVADGVAIDSAGIGVGAGASISDAPRAFASRALASIASASRTSAIRRIAPRWCRGVTSARAAAATIVRSIRGAIQRPPMAAPAVAAEATTAMPRASAFSRAWCGTISSPAEIACSSAHTLRLSSERPADAGTRRSRSIPRSDSESHPDSSRNRFISSSPSVHGRPRGKPSSYGPKWTARGRLSTRGPTFLPTGDRFLPGPC